MKNISRKKWLVILVMLYSCASPYTYETEAQYYSGIKTALAKDQYSLAAARVIELERNYPNSKYLCEIYSAQIAWKESQGQEVDNIKVKYKNYCLKKE